MYLIAHIGNQHLETSVTLYIQSEWPCNLTATIASGNVLQVIH